MPRCTRRAAAPRRSFLHKLAGCIRPCRIGRRIFSERQRLLTSKSVQKDKKPNLFQSMTDAAVGGSQAASGSKVKMHTILKYHNIWYLQKATFVVTLVSSPHHRLLGRASYRSPTAKQTFLSSPSELCSRHQDVDAEDRIECSQFFVIDSINSFKRTPQACYLR